MDRPELLAPAGNMEKLKAALRFGADAVYLAGEQFGMRAAADNFSPEQIKQAVAYAHARGARVYVTVNVMPREEEYAALSEYLLFLGAAGPDALIVADLGVMALCRRLLPHMELHVSTQANVVSSAAALAFVALGAKRIVLARELTLAEIRSIRRALPPTVELEAFVHGSMCISYSGRCLLSGHMIGRDANRGRCAQPCRWEYVLRGEIEEVKRPELPLPIEEHNGETFIMASRDTCMIEHIPALMAAGIASFKIEGRMKSAYYVAALTNAYRCAIDAALADLPLDPAWRRETESVSHRAYATGYYFSDCRTDANLAPDNGYLCDRPYLALVEAYDEVRGMALLSQRKKFSVGDTVELLIPGGAGHAFCVGALYGEDGTQIESVPHPYMRFWLPVPIPVEEGDILRGGVPAVRE